MIDWILIATVATYVYVPAQVVIFIASYIRYIKPLSKRLASLKENQIFISKLSSSPSEISVKRNELEAQLFKGAQWAQLQFRQYAAAWRDARFHGEDKAACTVCFKSFLTPQVVINAAANQKTAEAIPGFFLAGGIFGTFLGIVFGLAGVNLTQSAQADVLLQGVRGIVEGMKLAFITSLIGIISSVGFSWWHRAVVRRLEMVVAEIDTSVSEIYPCITDEYYARQFLENLTDIKAQFQTLATDIALKISDSMAPALDSAVSKHLVPIVGEMQDIMARFFQKAGESQSKAVEEMLSQYVNMLQGSFTDQIDKIMQAIKETIEAQEQVRDSIIDFSERLNNQFSVQNDLLTKTTQTVEYFDKILDDLGDCASDLKEAARTSHEMATLFSEAAKAMEGIKDIKDNLSGLTTLISKDIREVTEYMEKLIDRISTTLSEQLTGALNSFDDKLAEVLSRFSGTLAETKDTIGELPSFIGDLSGSFDAIATKMDGQKEILEDIKATTHGLVSDNIQKAVDAANALSSSVQHMSSVAASLDGWMNQLSQIMKSGNLHQISEQNAGARSPAPPDADIKTNWETEINSLRSDLASLLEAIKDVSVNLNDTGRKLVDDVFQKIQTSDGQTLDEIKQVRTLLLNIETSASNVSKAFSELRVKESGERKGGVFGGLFGR